MPTFDFTSPEGKQYSVDGPGGATPEQAFAILQQHLGNKSPTFDAEGAKKAGYTDAEIRGVQGALAAGFSPAEISAHLSQKVPEGFILDKNPTGMFADIPSEPGRKSPAGMFSDIPSVGGKLGTVQGQPLRALLADLGCYLLENQAIAPADCIVRFAEPLRPTPARSSSRPRRWSPTAIPGCASFTGGITEVCGVLRLRSATASGVSRTRAVGRTCGR